MPVDHLDLKAKISPSDSFLQVDADLVLSGFDETMKLLLNPCLELTSIKFNVDDSWKKMEFTEKPPPQDIFMPVACYELAIPEEIQEEDQISIHAEYQGCLYRYLFDTTRIREDFVELAIYAAWYPMTSFADRPTYRLELDAPEDWTWIANAQRISESYLIWEATTPRTDLTLHGRPIDDAISPEDSELFWGSPRNLDALKPLEGEFNPFKNLIRDWLGPTDNDTLKIVLVSRDFGGGYARSGLIVLQDDIGDDITDSKKKSILKYWSHEFAHFWWKKTTVENYHNWIDEALAEYTARMACEEVIGQEYFEELIQALRDAIKTEESLPPIKETLRQHSKAQTVFYVYGSLILHEIRETIGKQRFLDFLRAFAQKEVNADKVTTADMIATLENITGEDWEEHIEKRITMEPEPL